jgi:hypothetical protein
MRARSLAVINRSLAENFAQEQIDAWEYDQNGEPVRLKEVKPE